MIRNGTRQRREYYGSHPESRLPNTKMTRDVGLNKLLTVSATFSSTTLTDVASDFVAAGFAAQDQIIIWNSASNNGVRTIISLTTTALTCDFPFVTEGPTAGVVVRNT